MVTHKSLLAIQFRLFEIVRNHIYSITGYDSNELICYEHEFLQSVEQHPKPVETTVFRKSLLSSRMILVGDFHSLPANQRCFLNLLKFLVRSKKPKPVIIALECFFKEDQKYLDEFLSGKISAETFYKSIDFHDHWGFPWEPLLDILNFARKYNIQVAGINKYSGCMESRIGLHEKDEIFAQTCVKLLKAQPDAQLLLLAGEYHISANHLPAKILPQCPDLTLGKNVSLVHFGIDKFYFEILANDPHHLNSLWGIGPGQYVIFECPPWGKWLSWLQWQEHKIYSSDCQYCLEQQSDLHCFFESEEILKECWGLFQHYLAGDCKYPDFCQIVSGISDKKFRSKKVTKKEIPRRRYQVKNTEFDRRNKRLFLESLSWESMVHGLGLGLHSELNETMLLSDLKVTTSMMEFLFNPVGQAGVSRDLFSESCHGKIKPGIEKPDRYRLLFSQFYQSDRLSIELEKMLLQRKRLTLSRYLDNFELSESASGRGTNIFLHDHKETR